MTRELQQTSPTARIAAISWTGGKDCNLALLRSWRNSNLNVKYLLTFRPEGKQFHAHPIRVMEGQASALGLELIFVTIPADTTDYMQAYIDGTKKIQQEHGIQVVVTGDMDLVGTMDRNWIERCCERVGGDMKCDLPLWNANREECLEELLREGFEIIFSCVKSPFFDGNWINRVLDQATLAELKRMADKGLTDEQIQSGLKPLDLCGERGEYHTMVVNGPIYSSKVAIDSNDVPHMEERQSKWKGNIHNADRIWTISLKS